MNKMIGSYDNVYLSTGEDISELVEHSQDRFKDLIHEAKCKHAYLKHQLIESTEDTDNIEAIIIQLDKRIRKNEIHIGLVNE